MYSSPFAWYVGYNILGICGHLSLYICNFNVKTTNAPLFTIFAATDIATFN